jgi:hypothetical protein
MDDAPAIITSTIYESSPPNPLNTLWACKNQPWNLWTTEIYIITTSLKLKFTVLSLVVSDLYCNILQYMRPARYVQTSLVSLQVIYEFFKA